VPDEVKRRRNNELLALQNEISEEDNHAFLGQQLTVLVEGPSKAAEKHAFDPSAASPQSPAPSAQLQLTGRTHCDRIVVFTGNHRQIGQFLSVTIYDANAHTLFGEVVTRHTGPELYSLSARSVV
jgi:tRNA-2-methylthio-N6-dimethylallyladenosine synthase